MLEEVRAVPSEAEGSFSTWTSLSHHVECKGEDLSRHARAKSPPVYLFLCQFLKVLGIYFRSAGSEQRKGTLEFRKQWLWPGKAVKGSTEDDSCVGGPGGQPAQAGAEGGGYWADAFWGRGWGGLLLKCLIWYSS